MAVGVQVPPSAPSKKGTMTLSCCLLFFFVALEISYMRDRYIFGHMLDVM